MNIFIILSVIMWLLIGMIPLLNEIKIAGKFKTNMLIICWTFIIGPINLMLYLLICNEKIILFKRKK